MLPSSSREPILPAGMRPSPPTPSTAVPWRTILATIGAVLGTAATIFALWKLSRIVTLLLVAAFFAVVLTPPVNFLVHRLRFRRALATMLVFIVGIAAVAAMLYTFIRPIVDQTQKFVEDFPEYVEDAQNGRGAVGGLVKRYDLEKRVAENQKRLEQFRNDAGKRIPNVLRSLANGIVALLTILVLTFLMVLEGPKIQASLLNLVESPRRPGRRERVRRVASDSARAVTGYMAGNLLISVVAGTFTFIFLLIAGVPFQGVLALWVAFADLIPLVGATLGAVPTVLVAFLHSPVAGIATIVFFVLYQQFENHVLQVTIMSRTVDLNPLAVIISVLIGVDLFGLLGALLAIPVAGIVQVIARDIYDERRGELKEEPTIGTDEIPMSQASED